MDKGFRLLGIRPITECNRRFHKNLKINELYWFYHNFKAAINAENEIISIELSPSAVDDFYSIQRNEEEDLKIHISALVGKNGSGKSALSELLLLSLFIISNKFGFIKRHNFLNIAGKNENDIEEKLRYDDDQKIIDSELHTEIVYQKDKTIHILQILNGKLFLKSSTKIDDKFIFKNKFIEVNSFSELQPFFYTMVTNYSLYGLNTNETGMWLKAFFHKNDSYQMPVVINPYRSEGKIDINIETYLTRSRLLSNVLSIKNFTEIYKKSGVSSIELYFDKNKDYRQVLNTEEERYTERYSLNFIKDFRKKLIKPLYDLIFSSTEEYPSIDTTLKQVAEVYIIKKMITIAGRYSQYSEYNSIIPNKFTDPFIIDKDSADKYARALFEDRGHVTLKLRQTINFLRRDIFNIDLDSETILNFDEIRKSIIELETKFWFTELEDYIPPPFFTSKIKFKNGSDFDNLSSGEKQYIYSFNTIVYHLKNLDSVHKSTKELETYDSINLILDEIELYYHPEFQQSTIKDLLFFIKKADLKKIKNLNILFLTHSPFILSDIPHTNVLKLKDGNPESYKETERTFGGNIHQLLANDFFLNKGHIGLFAKEKINNVISEIIKVSKQSNETSKDISKEKRNYLIELINLIGDPIIRHKLSDMFYELFENFDHETAEIKMLEDRINYLKSRGNDFN